MMNMQPVVPPTAQGLVHKQRLYIVMAVHLFLAILYMFFNFMSGIFELISVLILYCGTAQMNYCQLIIYMIIQGHKFVVNFSTLGLMIQKGILTDLMRDAYYCFYIILMVAFSIFYVVAITLAFYAYREFKGMMFDNGMGGAGGIANLMPMG